MLDGYVCRNENIRTVSSEFTEMIFVCSVPVLISLAVAGVLLVGILGLVYHKYSKKELKASFPSRSGSNRKVSYGFEGADDVSTNNCFFIAPKLSLAILRFSWFFIIQRFEMYWCAVFLQSKNWIVLMLCLFSLRLEEENW